MAIQIDEFYTHFRFQEMRKSSRSTIGIAYFQSQPNCPATAIVKILTPHSNSHKEAHVTLCLQDSCRYLLRLYCFYFTSRHYVLFFEHCTGGTVNDKLMQRCGNWKEWKLLEWFRQLVEAVATMHFKHYAHRDINPSNIFFTANEEIRLGDFGETSAVREKLFTHYPVGSPQYAPAPLRVTTPGGEQVSKECGYLHDIWSLGRTFYEMCIGSYVAEMNNRVENMPHLLTMVGYELSVREISGGLARLILDMLSIEVQPMTIFQVQHTLASLQAAYEPLRPLDPPIEVTTPSFSSNRS